MCRGLLDADQLDALGTLRRTDSAPNLGEQERLPFRQRRAVKKAAKAEKKGKKAERKAERKASKGRGRPHRCAFCVPMECNSLMVSRAAAWGSDLGG